MITTTSLFPARFGRAAGLALFGCTAGLVLFGCAVAEVSYEADGGPVPGPIDPGAASPTCADPGACCPHGKLTCELQEDGSIRCSCRSPDGPGHACIPVEQGSGALAAALGFNLFLFGDLAQTGSDTEGRLAAGGDATLESYSVGTALPPAHGAQDTLIVGGALRYANGTVASGNAVHGLAATFTNVGFPDGTHRQDRPLDFAALAAEVRERSQAWAGLAPNGTTTVEYAGGSVVRITLQGTDPGLNVLAVSAADLAAASALAVEAPAGATVLVTIDGAQGRLTDLGFAVSGTDRRHVIYHFPEATTLTLAGVGVEGTVLAPRARVEFSSGHINGTLIAASLSGPGEAHAQPFAGCVPAP